MFNSHDIVRVTASGRVGIVQRVADGTEKPNYVQFDGNAETAAHFADCELESLDSLKEPRPFGLVPENPL
jgi:hypothetical protein